MNPIGLYDGKIVPLDQPVVNLEDRGHQFGDGVYEVIVAYKGEYFAMKEHLDRLDRSCREIRLEPCYTRAEIEGFAKELMEKSGITEAMLYLQWTRGVAPRYHGFPANARPILSGTIRPRRVLTDEMFEHGVKSMILPDLRWMRCDIKSLNLLGAVLSKQQAAEAGCFEAILERDGKVTEGSSSNSFAVKDGIIYTSPVGNLILAGVTRAKVIKIAQDLGYEVREEFVSTDFYRQADEIFLTGTTTEVMPITILDEKPVADGKVGPITRKLQQEYFKLIGKIKA